MEQQDHTRIEMTRAIELLFADSSKNFSDLKSREWNATYYGVLAIAGSAALARSCPSAALEEWPATIFILLIWICHWITIWKCEKNLGVFRTRIRKLIIRHFSKESRALFKERREFEEEKDFEDAVVDEGRITFILYGSTLITLGCSLYLVWH